MKGKVYSVRYEKQTSTELAATLIIECDSPALKMLKAYTDGVHSALSATARLRSCVPLRKEKGEK